MKRFYALLLPALFSTTISFAQSNFRSGYIVNLQGDTLKGTINHKDWVRNPDIIQFKNTQGKVSDQTPANTKAFSVKGGGDYRTFTVGLTNDDISKEGVRATYDTTKTVKTVFLKVIAQGKNLNLYSYTDKLKPRFLLSDGNATPFELEFHIYRVNTNEKAVYGYRGDLMSRYYALKMDSKMLLSKIEGADYWEEELAVIVNLLNGEKKVVEKMPTESKTRFFAGLSAMSGDLKYTGSVDLAQDPKSISSTLPQLSVGVDFLQNAAVGRWFIRGELSVFTGDLKAGSANASKSMKTLTFSLKPQFFYNIYVKDPLKVFVGAGLAINLSSYSNINYVATNNKYNLVNGEQEPHSIGVSFPLKAGIALWDRVELYAAYNAGPPIEKNDAIKVSAAYNTIQGGINILLGKK